MSINSVKMCPLMSYREHVSTKYCPGKDCAWWDEEEDCCAIKSFLKKDKPLETIRITDCEEYYI